MSQGFEQLGSPSHDLDTLTGLPNRAVFEMSLDSAIARVPGQFGVLFIDLDGLKTVNDTDGHRAGNELLAKAGEQLGRVFTDNFVARLHGDEFAALIRGTRDPLQLHLTATQAQAALGENGIEASVGAALHKSGEPAASLLHRADLAMYDNKSERRLSRYSQKQLGAIATIEEIANSHNLNLRDVASLIEGMRKQSES